MSVRRLMGRSTAALPAMILAVVFSATSLRAYAGSILPPAATPHGWSLEDMAQAVANFSISGNDPLFYPDTPFQILYRHDVHDPTQGGTFHVKSGTYIYVKFFFIDDSAPIIGDWPADKSEVADYVFGRDQLGGHDLEIEVDGKVTSINDVAYVGGPVSTPDSPDGSEHMLQIGAFLSPLSKGTHKVTIRGVFDGDAFVDFVGGPFAASITYTVIVE